VQAAQAARRTGPCAVPPAAVTRFPVPRLQGTRHPCRHPFCRFAPSYLSPYIPFYLPACRHPTTAMAPKREAPDAPPLYALTFESGNASGAPTAVALGTVTTKVGAVRRAATAMNNRCQWGDAWASADGFDVHKAARRAVDCPDVGTVINVVDPKGLFARVRIALVAASGAPPPKRAAAAAAGGGKATRPTAAPDKTPAVAPKPTAKAAKASATQPAKKATAKAAKTAAAVPTKKAGAEGATAGAPAPTKKPRAKAAAQPPKKTHAKAAKAAASHTPARSAAQVAKAAAATAPAAASLPPTKKPATKATKAAAAAAAKAKPPAATAAKAAKGDGGAGAAGATPAAPTVYVLTYTRGNARSDSRSAVAQVVGSKAAALRGAKAVMATHAGWRSDDSADGDGGLRCEVVTSAARVVDGATLVKVTDMEGSYNRVTVAVRTLDGATGADASGAVWVLTEVRSTPYEPDVSTLVAVVTTPAAAVRAAAATLTNTFGDDWLEPDVWEERRPPSVSRVRDGHVLAALVDGEGTSVRIRSTWCMGAGTAGSARWEANPSVEGVRAVLDGRVASVSPASSPPPLNMGGWGGGHGRGRTKQTARKSSQQRMPQSRQPAAGDEGWMSPEGGPY